MSKVKNVLTRIGLGAMGMLLSLGVFGSVGVIGAITFVLCIGAVYLGRAIGNKLADKAGLAGGIVLVGIGIKLLIEGLL